MLRCVQILPSGEDLLLAFNLGTQSIGTCIRRLTTKTSMSLASSLGSAILAYRKVCQKGAGRVGA